MTHTEELNRVTKRVCNLFADYGIHYSEQRAFPSYGAVSGKCKELNGIIPLSEKAIPLSNPDEKDLANALGACQRLGRKFFDLDKGQLISVISRDYMIEGTTLPIRVRYLIQGQAGRDFRTLYVKQMHLNRIFIGALYHIINDEAIQMYFSESSVVQPHVEGKTLTEAYESDNRFLGNPRVRKKLVKLSVDSHFLCLNDMDNGSNVIVDRWRRFHVIDFDKAFWEPVPDPILELVNPLEFEYRPGEYREVPLDKINKYFEKGELEDLVRAEKTRIIVNVKKHEEIFWQIAELMDGFRYYKDSAKLFFKVKKPSQYFLKRLAEFSKF